MMLFQRVDLRDLAPDPEVIRGTLLYMFFNLASLWVGLADAVNLGEFGERSSRKSNY